MNDMNTVRHGDVILVPTEIPEGAKQVFEGTEFVAALGETTGHRHMVKAPEKFTVYESKGVRYFRFTVPARITHEEHKPLVLEPITYRQDQEIEKDWFSLAVRKVID